jgi:hypothetical protein
VQRLHGQHNVGGSIGKIGGIGPAGHVSHVRKARRRFRPDPHVVAGLDADHFGRPAGSPSCRQTSAAAEIDGNGRPAASGITDDDVGELRWRPWSNSVVQIGETGEPVGVRIEAHGEKLATDLVAHAFLDERASRLQLTVGQLLSRCIDPESRLDAIEVEFECGLVHA